MHLKVSTQRWSIRRANATTCKPASVSANRSSSRAKRRNRAAQALLHSITLRRDSSTKPFFASGSLTTSRRICWAWASSAACAPVYPWSTFGGRWQGAAIADRRRGFGRASLCQPQHSAQILPKGVKQHAGCEPALALLVHRRPRRQIMRHPPPRRLCADDPAQAIEDLAQAVLPRRRLFGHKGQIREDQGPFIITDITGVRFACHTLSLASSRRKCITRSNATTRSWIWAALSNVCNITCSEEYTRQPVR
jgi:hypothetical protein